MTKAETIAKISAATGILKEDVERVLEEFFITVKGSLSEGENIYIRGFGSFIVRIRAEKKARNISLKSTITVPAQPVPHFKPSPDFMEQVKAGN